MLFHILFIVALAGISRECNVLAQHRTSCLTPVKEPGSCVLVAECTFIRKVLQKRILDENDIRYIEASRCGSYEKKALVCCAKPDPAPATNKPPSTESPPLETRIDVAEKRKLLPAPPVCGIQYSDRIIGGERTKIDEYPWTARIQHYDERSLEYAFHCGGSLINELYVLTAAHCISGIPKSWKLSAVRLGEWDTQTDPDCEEDGSDCYDKVQDINIVNAISHENFINTRSEVHNDIGLLRLARKVTYSDTVVPICLPLDDSFSQRPYETIKMFVTGWGQTETERGSRYKLFVRVGGVPLDYCRSQYPSANIDSRQICAGGEPGKDSCKGDSGGPLMDVVLTRGQVVHYLAGVVSFGKQCGKSGVPGVYTKTNRFSDWILAHIEP